MAALILIILIIIALYVLNYKTLKDTKAFASDEELDKLTEVLPSNEEICMDIGEMLGSTCKVELDNKSKSSAYIFFSDKIILSNTKSSQKNFSRVLFIAHECVHSVQEKSMHIINFILANISNLYDIFLIVLLLMRKASLELVTVSFIISILSFYYRIILETDAVYRSVIYSRKYLESKNLNVVADRYEEIVPKTISGMYFSHIMPILIRHLVFLSLLLWGGI